MILSPKHLSGNKIRLYFLKYKKYLFKIKTKTLLAGPSRSIHVRQDMGGRAGSQVSTP